MKVNLKFNGMPILYKTLNRKKEVEIEFTGNTLRELIVRLTGKYGLPMQKALLDKNGDVDVEIRVVLNGASYLTECRMETVLNDGDTLAFMGAS
ncbi:MAG: MoaD/ThiS family protein [Deltaproteobacteria bacterium]|nr:MoaD/ThiS family protein [Deltaproteobacteria bacterium]